MSVQTVELSVMNLALLVATARSAWVLLVATAWERKNHMAMETGATPWHDGPEVDQGAAGAVADRATFGWSLPRGSALKAREHVDRSQVCGG